MKDHRGKHSLRLSGEPGMLLERAPGRRRDDQEVEKGEHTKRRESASMIEVGFTLQSSKGRACLNQGG